MPDDFSDYVVSEPTRTRKGALKYQPVDSDWSIDRLPELQDYFSSTYKRALPVTVKGQGSIHNKWGLDHRSSADISLNPSTSEGKAFIAELQKRKVPFLAFDRAIPGSSTGPHIHVGRPSSRNATKYSVGAQVKRTGKTSKAQPSPTPDDFDKYVTAADSTDDFDKYAVNETAVAPTKAATPTDLSAFKPTRSYGDIATGKPRSKPAGGPVTDPVAAGVADYETSQRRAIEAAVNEYEGGGVGNLRRAEGRDQRIAADTGVGRLRQLDEPALAQVTRIQKEVADETAELARSRASGSEAQLLAQRFREGNQSVEVANRIREENTAASRYRELVGSLTDDDRRQLGDALTRMRGMGSTSRGIETGAQKMGSGLLYKLAGLIDASPNTLALRTAGINAPSVLSDYLRRQAGRGEVTIQEIEAELPPDTRQQLADFVTHSITALPEIYGATMLGGPIGGFAALGGLEAAGRKQSFADIAKETVKGAVIGAVFKGAGAAEGATATLGQRAVGTAKSSLGVGLGTFAVDKAFGADDADALRAAASNIVFHVGMKVPGEVGRFAQAAERALKTPTPEGSTSTIGPELQTRLESTATLPPETAQVAERTLKSPTEPLPADRPAIRQLGKRKFEVDHEMASGSATFVVKSRAEAEALVDRLGATESLSPAELTAQPPSTAGPAVDVLAGIPTAPSRRPLTELMAERAETGPTEPTGPINLLTGKPAPRRPGTEGEEGVFNLRALFGKKEKKPTPNEIRARMDREDAEIRAKFQAEIAAEKGTEPFLRQPRTVEEAGQRYTDLVGRMLYLNGHIADAQRLGLTKAEVDGLWKQHADTLRKAMAVEKHITDQGYKVNPLGQVAKANESFPPYRSDSRKGEGGHIDLNEIREGFRAGKVKVEEALGQLKLRFPSRTESQLLPLLNRKSDPLIGIVDKGEVLSYTDRFREREHAEVFGMDNTVRVQTNNRWRYEPATEKVYWSDSAMDHVAKESQQAVEVYLARQDLRVKEHGMLKDWYSDAKGIKETESRPPVHHAAQQPRTDTGQFSPGLPGGMEAARTQLRSEARKYRDQYKSLDTHQARREGLDIVNDDVARSYFTRLHRMAAEFTPKQAAAVDRAESLYNQGKYGQATMLAESVFRSLPDKVNEYAAADAAIQLTERGIEAKSDWSKVLTEVRERLKRTGGLSGGGSTFYDVNKRPEGGRPDHAKIAYILEPVVEALKTDARRFIAEGKLKAADYTAHIRTEVNKMLQGSDFNDWHPLNKSAALGVLVDKLRSDGPPAESTSAQRPRSLPKTLEKSGRDPGTNLTYDRLPNRQVNERIEARLAAEGANALETWYRNAPESADRTAAHRVLVNHYTAEAVKLADTAPQRAGELMQQARELSNLESERATTLGQAIQQYSQLRKYTPAGVLSELSRMEKAGVKVPAEQGIALTKAAQEHQRLDKEVKRLERKVAEAEVAEGEGPQGAEAPTRPRTYRPRTDNTLSVSGAERARRQLDEAAKRRRAQKAFIARQLQQLEQQRTASGYWKRSMNLTRGLMVSAFSTAMRNLQSQVVRFDIERLDDMVEHTIRRSVGLDSDLTTRNIWRNTARQFKFNQTREAREILSNHPEELSRMFNNYAGGVDVPIPGKARHAVERVFQTAERGVEIANFFNRVQEFHVRSAEFLAELDLHLRKDKNLSLEKFVQRNGIDAIPQETVGKAVDKALEVTFADMPAKDGAGGRLLTSLIEVGNYIPPTLSPVAFPRFMFNNIKFLYQHSPAGMIDLARKGQNKPRVVARALVGTSMLLLAYQFRQSDHAGEKWYELKLGDTTLDARPFGPFSTYLFMAEAIRRQLNGEKAFTVQEIAGAIGASSGPGGSAIAVAEKLYDYAANGQWDKWQRIAKTEAGEWGRAILTPVRQVKDLIAAFDESQAITRDISAEPALGPLKESIPYLSDGLPPAQRATTATPIKQERPAMKALTGWRAITPKTFLEKQLDELNFSSTEVRQNTGIPAIDALEKRLMGPLMDQLSAELEKDAEFKKLTKVARAKFLKDFIADIRADVRAMGKAEQPELYEQLKEERTPRRDREFNEELNSPGLSGALQLGVPMPIPPRRADEDDIAYRARLLQVGRARRAKLDDAVDFTTDRNTQRSRLHAALYS